MATAWRVSRWVSIKLTRTKTGKSTARSGHQVDVVGISGRDKGQAELFRRGSVHPDSLVATFDGATMDVDAATSEQTGTGDKMGTTGFVAINVCGKGQEEALFRRGSVHPASLVATKERERQLANGSGDTTASKSPGQHTVGHSDDRTGCGWKGREWQHADDAISAREKGREWQNDDHVPCVGKPRTKAEKHVLKRVRKRLADRGWTTFARCGCEPVASPPTIFELPDYLVWEGRGIAVAAAGSVCLQRLVDFLILDKPPISTVSDGAMALETGLDRWTIPQLAQFSVSHHAERDLLDDDCEMIERILCHVGHLADEAAMLRR